MVFLSSTYVLYYLLIQSIMRKDMFRKTTLKNGLRIITASQRGTEAATVLILVGTGSKYETKKTSGISHLVEHLVFKGTKKKPTPLEVIEPIDKIGGIWNAFTGEEYTGYFAKVAAPHVEMALDWVSDIYLNPLLPKQEIKKEKRVIIEEINMGYDLPTRYIEILWNKLLYGDQPAGWDIAGTKDTVAQMSRQDILSYIKSQYVASNTIICLAGRIKEERLILKVKKYFSSIRTTQTKTKPMVIERQSKPQYLLHPKETDQTHLRLGVRGYNFFHPQRYAQDLLGLILGGMKSSRLFVEIREKLGMAYYVSTAVDASSDTGSLATQAGIDNKRVGKAITVILKEYRKISQKKVSEIELRKAKDHIKGKMALVLESSDALASFYGIQELLEKKILTSNEIYDKINKVSASDISRVARSIFRPANLNLVLIGPFKDKDKFLKLLKL